MTIRVVREVGARSRGFLAVGGLVVPCALGRSGIVATKREGDGGTPAGEFALLAVLYRPDRGPRPATRLPVIPIRRTADGATTRPTRRIIARSASPTPAATNACGATTASTTSSSSWISTCILSAAVVAAPFSCT